MGEGGPDHVYPGCGRPQPLHERHPRRFCRGCLSRAENGDGQRLAFFNASFSGGLTWCLAEEAGRFEGGPDVGAVLCLIDGRRVLVQEARTGGVVAQPVTDRPLPGRGIALLDLSRPQRAGTP